MGVDGVAVVSLTVYVDVYLIGGLCASLLICTTSIVAHCSSYTLNTASG